MSDCEHAAEPSSSCAVCQVITDRPNNTFSAKIAQHLPCLCITIRGMNDARQIEKFREAEEQSTRDRAALLGLSYFDSRGVSTVAPLIKNLLSNQEMYAGNLVPL